MDRYEQPVSRRVATAMLPAGVALPGRMDDVKIAHGAYEGRIATLRIKEFCGGFYCYSHTVPQWDWEEVFNVNPDGHI